jgi:hypothetical protein
MADTLASLAADLARAAVAITPATLAITRGSAAQIKQDWMGTWPWSGSTHLPLQTKKGPGLGRRIGYDVGATGAGVSAEIGVNREGASKVGKLANIIEFGSVNNPPHPGGAPALAKNAPLYVAQLAAMAQALVLGSTTGGPGRFNPRNKAGDAWSGYEGVTQPWLGPWEKRS